MISIEGKDLKLASMLTVLCAVVVGALFLILTGFARLSPAVVP